MGRKRGATMDTVDGGAIRQLRRARGLTMRQLATAAEVDHAVVSRLERQVQSDVSARALAKLALALGVPVDAVLTETFRAGAHPPIAELAVEIADLGALPERQQALVATILRAHRAAIADGAAAVGSATP